MDHQKQYIADKLINYDYFKSCLGPHSSTGSNKEQYLDYMECLNSFQINGKQIFKGLKPAEINQLFTLFQTFYLNHKIALAIKFAEYEKVENFTDFCAACDFAVLWLAENRKWDDEQQSPNSQKLIEEEIKYVKDDFFTDDADAKCYKIVYDECKERIKREGQSMLQSSQVKEQLRLINKDVIDGKFPR